jgi:hypothetical protein
MVRYQSRLTGRTVRLGQIGRIIIFWDTYQRTNAEVCGMRVPYRIWAIQPERP